MKNVIVILCVISLGFLGYKMFFSLSDEQKILKVLEEFKQKAYITESLGHLAIVGKAKELSGFFTENVKFVYNTKSREDVPFLGGILFKNGADKRTPWWIFKST